MLSSETDPLNIRIAGALTTRVAHRFRIRFIDCANTATNSKIQQQKDAIDQLIFDS